MAFRDQVAVKLAVTKLACQLGISVIPTDCMEIFSEISTDIFFRNSHGNFSPKVQKSRRSPRDDLKS